MVPDEGPHRGPIAYKEDIDNAFGSNVDLVTVVKEHGKQPRTTTRPGTCQRFARTSRPCHTHRTRSKPAVGSRSSVPRGGDGRGTLPNEYYPQPKEALTTMAKLSPAQALSKSDSIRP